MTLPPFRYVVPVRLDDALDLLAEHGPGARVMAGGTDIIVAMRERGLRLGCLVDLKHIPGLAAIGVGPSGSLSIGSLTPVRDVERSAVVRDGWGVLASAAGMLASIQVRNKATLGGNICNASPAADLAPPLLVLDAVAVAYGRQGERSIPMAQLFAGPGRTTLNGDILTGFTIPPMPGGARAVHLKHGPRNAMDIAIAGVAVLAVPDASGTRWADARIALGSVAPTPIRATAAEAALRGALIGPESIDEAARLAAEAASPIGDVRGSADYRRAMIAALTRRALQEVSA